MQNFSADICRTHARYEITLTFRFKLAWFVSGTVYRGDKVVSKVKAVLAVVDKKRFRGRYAKKAEEQPAEEKEKKQPQEDSGEQE